MRYIAWIVGLVVVDVVILFVWQAAVTEENCGNGVARWTCGDLLQETLVPVLPYIFVGTATLTLGVLSLAIGHAIKAGFRRRQTGGQ